MRGSECSECWVLLFIICCKHLSHGGTSSAQPCELLRSYPAPVWLYPLLHSRCIIILACHVKFQLELPLLKNRCTGKIRKSCVRTKQNGSSVSLSWGDLKQTMCSLLCLLLSAYTPRCSALAQLIGGMLIPNRCEDTPPLWLLEAEWNPQLLFGYWLSEDQKFSVR